MTKEIAIVQFKTVDIFATNTRPANTTAYAAGDVISDDTTNNHLTFNGVSDRIVLTGSIDAARCVSNAAPATLPDLELWLFHTDIAKVADNGAFAPTDAEMLTLIGVIDFAVADWKVGAVGSNAGCFVENIGLPFKAHTTILYGQLVVRNAYTPVSAEVVTVALMIAKD